MDRFYAPELIRAWNLYAEGKLGIDDEVHAYGSPVDVYAFAVTLWELAWRDVAYGQAALGPKGCTPRTKQRNKMAFWDSVLEMKRPDPLPEMFGEGFCSLLKDCWKDAPDERPVFTDILVRTCQGRRALDLCYACCLRSRALAIPQSSTAISWGMKRY